MKALKVLSMVVLANVFCLSTVFAQDKPGTRDEAKKMVEDAIAHIKAVGVDKAFEDFTNNQQPGSKWKDRDLYLFCYKMDGVNACHGANKALVGKNLWELKTADGKLLMQEFAALIKSKGTGWVDYKWTHPVSKAIEDKSAYVSKIPGYDGYLGAGVYR